MSGQAVQYNSFLTWISDCDPGVEDVETAEKKAKTGKLLRPPDFDNTTQTAQRLVGSPEGNICEVNWYLKWCIM